jgi:hypothetical protein
MSHLKYKNPSDSYGGFSANITTGIFVARTMTHNINIEKLRAAPQKSRRNSTRRSAICTKELVIPHILDDDSLSRLIEVRHNCLVD